MTTTWAPIELCVATSNVMHHTAELHYSMLRKILKSLGLGKKVPQYERELHIGLKSTQFEIL